MVWVTIWAIYSQPHLVTLTRAHTDTEAQMDGRTAVPDKESSGYRVARYIF
jgi:hypothetical protein